MLAKSSSLRTSILLFVAIGLMLPALLALPLLYSNYRSETQRRIDLQLAQYANVLALGAREPLWNLSADAVRPLVEAVLNDPDVVSVQIVDRTAGALIDIDRSRKGAEVTRSERPVSYKERDLGVVRVGMTGDSVRAQQTAQMTAIMVITVAQLGSAAALIFVLLRRRLVKPLETLGNAADALARGELDRAIPAAGHDEIGHLASRLEGTRKELVQLFADLGRKNAELAQELAERQRSEAALREAEERLQTIFALTATPMAVVRKQDDQLVVTNPAWRDTFGYRDEQAVGRTPAELGLWVDPAVREACHVELDRSGQLAGREVRMRRRDGRELLLEASARSFRAGDETLQVWNLRDITEARRAENALRDSEQRFAALFHRAPVALAILDIEDRRILLDVNAQFERDFAFARAACVGRSLDDLDVWAHPADGERFAELMSADDAPEKINVWTRRPDGQLICRDISGRRITLHGRECFVWSAIDVTLIVHAKEAMEAVNRTLEDKVARRTRDLENAMAEQGALLERLQTARVQLVQSEKLAALGSLVAGITHELNTPIGNCLMAASTLDDQRREFVGNAADGLRRSQFTAFMSLLDDSAQTLLRNLHRAADLLTSFKQFATDQVNDETRRSFDLREIAREIEVTLAPTFRKARCAFSTNIAEDLVFDGFPGPLGQVITNLCTNAIVHGFEGRGDGEISLSARALDADTVQLVFADNGRGIAAEHLGKIFDPFFTTRMGRGGTGLGLNIVYNIVTGRLGGSIEVDSTVGQGTRFTITLPRRAPPRSEEAAGNGEAPAS